MNPNFCYEFDGDRRYISGVFDTWQIINGGGGKLLRMELPIKCGELTLNGPSYDLKGCKAVIELTLSMIPKPGKTFLKTAYAHLAKDPSQITDEEGWILPITFIDAEGKLGVLGDVVLDGLCCYLIDHPEQMVLFFAEIDFIKQGCPEWLLPRQTSYSYLDTGYLCILAVCDDRDISNLPLDVDVSGLSLEGDSYFIIAINKALSHLIVPCLCSIYKNTGPSDFSVSDNEFFNNRDLEMHDIKSGLLYYTPVVYRHQNIGHVDGSTLTISYKGFCDMYLDITMHWWGNVKLNVSLKDGRIISFQNAGQYFDHDNDIPPYLKWLNLLVSIIVQAVVDAISDDLIKKIADHSASINATEINTIEWFGANETLTAVYLNESLVLQYS